MHANVVISLGTEDTLPAILSHIHQQGYGSNALVLRPRRTSIRQQLVRSGIPTAHMPARIDDAAAVLMIHAAGRSSLVADMTRRLGAPATWIVSPNGDWTLVDDDVVTPDPRPSEPAVRTTIPAIEQLPAPDESPDI